MNRPLPHKFLFSECAESTEPEAMRDERVAKQATWLAAVGAHGWREACRIAGVDEVTPHRWLRAYPDFAAAHRATSEDTAQRLERIIDEVATGERDATPQQMAALQFRLRALRPDVYRERSAVQIDATTRTVGDGDGSRARALLVEWSGAAAPRLSTIDAQPTNIG